jgi:formyl-CoA transferase
MESQAVGGLRLVASPIKVSGLAAPVPVPPPRLGQHSQEVLEELGYSAEQIRHLRASGVI